MAFLYFVWKIFTKLPENLETFYTAQKVSMHPVKFSASMEIFQMAREVSRWTGKIPDDLEKLQTTWKFWICPEKLPYTHSLMSWLYFAFKFNSNILWENFHFPRGQMVKNALRNVFFLFYLILLEGRCNSYLENNVFLEMLSLLLHWDLLSSGIYLGRFLSTRLYCTFAGK